MSEFIQPTPLEAAQAAELSAIVASEAAAEARVAAQEAIDYINAQTRGEIETDFEEITWTIDRTGDRNLLNLINLNNFDSSSDYTNINTLTTTHIYNDVAPTIPFIHEQLIIISCEQVEISDEEQNCCICMEAREKNDICSLNCQHKFCWVCVEKCVKRPDPYNCSLCRETVTKITVQTLQIKENLDNYCS
jgi:hypothetical protein